MIRHPCAAGAVAIAGATLGVRILGICPASAGETRVPTAGTLPPVRTVIHWPAALALAGSTKLPT